MTYFPLRNNERIAPELKLSKMGAVYYRDKRLVKEGVIKHFFKYYTAQGLERFNGIKLHLFENLRGEFFAQNSTGSYVFKLERITAEEAKKVRFFNLYRHRNEY